MNVEITWNGGFNHKEELLALAEKSDTFYMVSPFLAPDIEKIIEEMPTIKNLYVYTNIDGFDMGVEIIEALSRLQKYCEKESISLSMFYDDGLHGKVYLFYKGEKATGFVTASANFTTKGLTKNIEYGILIEDETLQNKMLNNVRNNVAHTLSAAYLSYLYGKAQEFKKKHPKQEKPSFKSAKFVRSEKTKETRYFLKTIGRDGKPHPKKPFVDDVKLGFKKATYHKGDVMVIHAKEHGLVVGIYMVLEDIPEEYTEDTWDKWPYKYMLRCLTPDFSKKWWQEEIKTLELPEDFIIHRLHEEDHVTMRGKDNLNAISYGSPFQLTKEFADYVLKRLNETL